MHSYKTLLVDCQNKISTVTLNRPEVRNSLNDELIDELTQLFKKEIPSLKPRVVLLKGTGPAFCAGGDLRWMEKSASHTPAQNRRSAMGLSKLLQLMNELSCPLIGAIHGAALGGGMGFVAVCDMVLASKETQFGFTEVRLGLIPAVIGPFVVAKIGETHARSLFLSAERFGAERAYEIGIIHKICENPDNLEATALGVIGNILESSPLALSAAKKFLSELKKLSPSRQRGLAVKTLANLRASTEGKEGIRAFLEKRKPNW